MTLALAYTIARENLLATGLATSIGSRNIANAQDPDASRKLAVRSTGGRGEVRFVDVRGVADPELFDRALEATSSRSAADAIASAIGRLGELGGASLGESGPAHLVGELRNALLAAAGSPNDETVARSAIAAAESLAAGLQGGAALVTSVRQDANSQLIEGVQRLTNLIDSFGRLNEQIVEGNLLHRDVTDQLDERNAVLRSISEFVAVRASARANGDMVVFSESGATLFETSPRTVYIDRAAVIQPGQSGPDILIDGVAVRVDGRLGGRLGGLLEVRDELAVALGRQFDELARGLIMATVESAQPGGPVLPDQAGLFTYPGGPALPPVSLQNGLAATIRVNPTVVPSAGGNIWRLRDGAISDPGDPSYVYNVTGAPGYSERMNQLVDRLGSPMPFDASAALGQSDTSVVDFAARSAGWLGRVHSRSQDELDGARIVADRATSAWQNKVGINIDDEIVLMIALEKSFQASSRLISAVSGMFDSILRATE
jgi:flagellar hook-associated protein 1